jgi:uridine kinase
LCVNVLVEYLQYIHSPIVVAVSGGSCSGKTYFSQQLTQALLQGDIMSIVIALDSYFKDVDDNTLPRDQNGRCIFDSIDSYHTREFISDIGLLLCGNAVCIPQYDIYLNKRITHHKNVCQPANIIIAEGLFVTTILQTLSCDIIDIFIDVSVQTLLQRRIMRDTQKYGVSAQVVRDRFESDVVSLYEEKIKLQKDDACIIVHNEYN